MPEPILPVIHTVRGQRVVLDSDLAALYETTTIAFNQAIKRNATRFPSDFAFQLTREEVANLKSQFVISTPEGGIPLRSQNVILKTGGRGQHRKYLPWAFTEHGAIMAATLLRSPRAVAMSVYVVRAFIRMREELATSAVILNASPRSTKSCSRTMSCCGTSTRNSSHCSALRQPLRPKNSDSTRARLGRERLRRNAGFRTCGERQQKVCFRGGVTGKRMQVRP